MNNETTSDFATPGKTILSRLRDHSSRDVEQTIRRLLKNGEIADYDDEIANRLRDAADLCEDVRGLLAQWRA